MTVERPAPPLAVTASTRRTSAGADYVPRRNTGTNEVHWCYVPRLRPGVDWAQYICGSGFASRPAGAPNTAITDNLTDGTPCPACAEKWSMT